MKKLEKVRVIRGNFTFKGSFIKNGLDSSRLINIIVTSDSPEDYKMSGYPCPPNLFYIHKISISETVGILINKYNLAAADAREKVSRWISELQITIIDPSDIESFEKIVSETNLIVIKELGEDYEIGDNDIKIIASFIKEGINVVHVKDKGFEETCRRLNINVINTPERDLKMEKELKKRLK